MPASTMDEVVSLCKRRGLIFPASEIYGGIANTYDYGHYGVLLKRNVIDAWWDAMLQERDDVVALLEHRVPPGIDDVALEQHAVVPVVVGVGDPAVDLGGR